MWSAIALVVSNMIGTGIFTTTGFLAGDLGQTSLVLGIWMVGALFALAGALCYSELGVNFPTSGGEYIYLREAYGPIWGFLSGWVSFFAGFSAPIAAAALAFANYLAFLSPSLSQQSSMLQWDIAGLTWRIGGTQALAAGLVVLLTLLNCVGIALVARVQNVLTTIKVVVIAAFVLLGLFAGQGSWDNLAAAAERTSTFSLPQQFAISLFWVMFGYSGWNAATYVAEEIKDPARTLPRALAIGAGLVTVLYLALNMVFFYAAPMEDMKNVAAIGSFSASHLFGPVGAGVFAGLMALSLMSTVNAMVTIGPRVYFAMARDGAFPAAAARVHARFRTPVTAIVAQAVCTMLMTMTPFPQLVLYIGMTLNFFTVMSVLSILLNRRRDGWLKLRAVSFAYPVVPLLFASVGLWMTYQGIMLQPYAAGATAMTLASGALMYRYILHNRPAMSVHARVDPNV